MLLNFKTITLTLLLLSCGNGFAGAMGDDYMPPTYNGLYVGGNIGIADLQDKNTHYISPEIHHLGGIGVIGGGIVGYDYSITEQFKLGIEGYGNATGLNTGIQHFNQTTGVQDNSEQMNMRYNAGIRILPGYQYTTDTEGHLILGYSNARFSNIDNGTYGYLDTQFNKNGFQGGIGWKATLFNQHTVLRLDAIYTRYSGQNSLGTGLAGSGSPYQFYNDTFSTLEAELSIIYKFS